MIHFVKYPPTPEQIPEIAAIAGSNDSVEKFLKEKEIGPNTKFAFKLASASSLVNGIIAWASVGTVSLAPTSIPTLPSISAEK